MVGQFYQVKEVNYIMFCVIFVNWMYACCC